MDDSAEDTEKPVANFYIVVARKESMGVVAGVLGGAQSALWAVNAR